MCGTDGLAFLRSLVFLFGDQPFVTFLTVKLLDAAQIMQILEPNWHSSCPALSK